jgi:hypothetical protein
LTNIRASVTGGLLEWDMWARIDRNTLLRPINTLLFDHKSSSPDSLLGLLPDINKPLLQRIAVTLASQAPLY